VSGAGLEVQRPELVHADHTAAVGHGAFGGGVVEPEQPGELGGELRVGRAFPGLGGLPGDPGRAQYLPDGFGAHGDPLVAPEMLDELGQRPGGER
jgi:hypothetical protein